jgi:outer membrane receptor protein involved in Fe transport
MRFILICLFAQIAVTAIAQPPGGMNRNTGNRPAMNGSFYGKVVEATTGKNIEFASVQLLQNKVDSATKKRKEVVVSGMITRSNGEFRMENIPVFGQYKLKIDIIGYKPYEQTVSFEMKMPQGGNTDMTSMLSALDKDLGNIKIDIAEKTLENVTVNAGNAGLRLGIDRKVFGVDRNIVSAGGTAVDVMRNIPSITVDIDGNVTMRNNTPQLFVDGRPTVLTLEQIPADAIESVEIITNPSAKFDASGGTAGILNVILKKNKRVGYSGNLRTNIDSRYRLGFGGDINVRQNKINVFASANINQRKSISTGETNRTTLISNPNTTLLQLDENIMKGRMLFFRGGLDYFINNRNTFSVSINKGGGKFSPLNEADMNIDSLYAIPTKSTGKRISLSDNEFNFTGITTSFKHLFPKAGEEWSIDLTYNQNSNKNSNTIKTSYQDNPLIPTNRSTEQLQKGEGDGTNLVIQTDYTKPLTDKSKLEIGARGQIRTSNTLNNFYLINGSIAIPLDALSVNYNSTDNVFAAYSTYSNQLKKWGYQLGLRVESSNYDGNLPDKNQSFNIKFPVSLFPSVFLTRNLKNNQEFQFNYTRKINRPNFFQLLPFTDYSDSLNISRGNPGLVPEFTNAVEFSYQKTFKNKDNFIAAAYFKHTDNLITRYQDQEINPTNGKQTLVNTFINANSSYVTGLELVSKNKLKNWWDLTSSFNLFTSKINLQDPTQATVDPFVSYQLKLNNTFKLFKTVTLQVSGEYISKSVLPPGGSGSGGGGGWGGGRGGGMMGMWGQASAAQGYQKANYFVDAALRYEFGKTRQASLSLNMSDVFRSRRQQIFSSSTIFTQDVFRRRDPQLLRLNFNWRFGKFDPNLFKRKSNKLMGEAMDNISM